MWGAVGLLVYEVSQLYIPGRRCDPFDVVAILVGTAIYLAYRKWRTRQAGVTHVVAT